MPTSLGTTHENISRPTRFRPDAVAKKKNTANLPPDFEARMNKMTDEELKERPLELGTSGVTEWQFVGT